MLLIVVVQINRSPLPLCKQVLYKNQNKAIEYFVRDFAPEDALECLSLAKKGLRYFRIVYGFTILMRFLVVSHLAMCLYDCRTRASHFTDEQDGTFEGQNVLSI